MNRAHYWSCVAEKLVDSSPSKMVSPACKRLPLSPVNAGTTLSCSIAVHRITPTKRRALTFSTHSNGEENELRSPEKQKSHVKALDFSSDGPCPNIELSPSKRGRYNHLKENIEVSCVPDVSESTSLNVESAKPHIARRLYDDAKTENPVPSSS